jgi:hypothetical protein
VTLADIPAHKLVPQKGEVDRFAWFSAEEVRIQNDAEPHNWCVGTHDFSIEYPCLRAVLTAAEHHGAIEPKQPIHTWMPLAI